MRGERLTISNEIAELRRMSEWLVSSGLACGIHQDVLRKLELCANEAVTNIISYAYDDSQGHDITLELDKTATGARLIIRDDGKPFNPLEVPPHRQPARLADATPGGLGIHLIRGLMSRCAYQRENGINVLRLEAHDTQQNKNE
jgi:anti-sigma regulatory factor (Ser/Thr protein kinase)